MVHTWGTIRICAAASLADFLLASPSSSDSFTFRVVDQDYIAHSFKWNRDGSWDPKIFTLDYLIVDADSGSSSVIMNIWVLRIRIRTFLLSGYGSRKLRILNPPILVGSGSISKRSGSASRYMNPGIKKSVYKLFHNSAKLNGRGERYYFKKSITWPYSLELREGTTKF